MKSSLFPRELGANWPFLKQSSSPLLLHRPRPEGAYLFPVLAKSYRQPPHPGASAPWEAVLNLLCPSHSSLRALPGLPSSTQHQRISSSGLSPVYAATSRAPRRVLLTSLLGDRIRNLMAFVLHPHSLTVSAAADTVSSPSHIFHAPLL